jgi:hypothetical protein
MGSHEKGWHEPAVDVLRTAWKSYPEIAEVAWEARVAVRPVSYGHVFEHYRKTWAESAQYILKLLDKGLSASDQKAVTDLITEGAKALASPAQDNFFWTHVADVILYRFCAEARQAVDVSVASQIAKAIQEDGGAPAWSVIAHSLGTAVTHNVISKMYAGSHVAGIPALKTGVTRPHCLLMAANVSRVLQLPELKVLETFVFPGLLTSGALCGHYLNARHAYDPFTWPYEFAPDEPSPRFSEPDYKHLRPEIILDGNVHALEHYLRQPGVHAPLFRLLRSEDLLSPEEERKAAEELAKASWNEGLNDLRHWFEEFSVFNGEDWVALVKIIRKYAKGP